MIQFTQNLMTNIKLIDDQHRELINHINAVSTMGTRATDKIEIEKTINALGAYIVKHFGDEEALQRKSGYPKYEWHRQQHQLYIAGFNDLKAEYASNGPSVQFALHLQKSIIDWILRHIKNVDVELGRFINQKNNA
jgi:hemerythrin